MRTILELCPHIGRKYALANCIQYIPYPMFMCQLLGHASKFQLTNIGYIERKTLSRMLIHIAWYKVICAFTLSYYLASTCVLESFLCFVLVSLSSHI